MIAYTISRLFVVLFQILLLSNGQLGVVSGGSDHPVITAYTPRAGPVSGGTVVHLNGSGFKPNDARCTFADPSRGSRAVYAEDVSSDETHMSCTLPAIDFLASPGPLDQVGAQHQINLIVFSADAVSNSVSFTLFDLALMHISGVAPNQGLNSTLTLVSVHGRGFVETGEISCAIPLPSPDNSFLEVPATFINHTLLTCELPEYPLPAKVKVDVYTNGDVTGIINSSTSATSAIFTFYSEPPKLISVHFSASYSFLYINFDRETEIGKEEDEMEELGLGSEDTNLSPQCETILSDNTLAIVGTKATCDWFNSQQRTIAVQLSSDTQVQVGTIVELRGGNIRTRQVQFSRLAAGRANITQPQQQHAYFLPASTPGNPGSGSSSVSLDPIPVLEAPNLIPYCGFLALSATSSQHGGPKPLLYKWEIIESKPTGGLSTHTNFTEYVPPPGFQPLSSLTIPSEAFQQNATYTILLTVMNFLQLEAYTSVNLTKQQTPRAPTVLILGGKGTRVVLVNRDFRLEGKVILPNNSSCLALEVGNSTIDYRWELFGASRNESIALNQSHLSVFTIPAYTLKPSEQTYTVSFTATAHNGILATASTQLIASLSGVIPKINGGTRRTVGQTDPIVLDGSASEGLTELLAQPGGSNFSVLWSCVELISEDGISTEGPCYLKDTVEEALLLPPDVVLSLKASSLLTGRYRFTVEIDHQGFCGKLHAQEPAIAIMHSVASQEVIVQSTTAAPLVFINPPLRQTSMPTHTHIVIKAEVYSVLPARVKWSNEYVEGE